jgi:hypothetical protein
MQPEPRSTTRTIRRTRRSERPTEAAWLNACEHKGNSSALLPRTSSLLLVVRTAPSRPRRQAATSAISGFQENGAAGSVKKRFQNATISCRPRNGLPPLMKTASSAIWPAKTGQIAAGHGVGEARLRGAHLFDPFTAAQRRCPRGAAGAGQRQGGEQDLAALSHGTDSNAKRRMAHVRTLRSTVRRPPQPLSAAWVTPFPLVALAGTRGSATAFTHPARAPAPAAESRTRAARRRACPARRPAWRAGSRRSCSARRRRSSARPAS